MTFFARKICWKMKKWIVTAILHWLVEFVRPVPPGLGKNRLPSWPSKESPI
jgi:hypothetical protein